MQSMEIGLSASANKNGGFSVKFEFLINSMEYFWHKYVSEGILCIYLQSQVERIQAKEPYFLAQTFALALRILLSVFWVK